MDPHVTDWLSLAVRWLHVIFGIAWIGSSFYFNWLNNHIRAPRHAEPGIKGELWSVHGGYFYRVVKLELAPERLPDTLHWFKWEAYFTWISGMVLLLLVYYLGADAYLIDRSVANLSRGAAVGISLAALLGSWIVYDVMCRSPLRRRPPLLAGVGFVLMLLATWGLTGVFSSRAAYLHVGAMLGTIMAANVFMIIIPSQRRMVAALMHHQTPDAAQGRDAGLRSLHNNYMTLPVVVTMISSHYPMAHSHPWSWAILGGLTLAGVAARHWFNLRGRGVANGWLLPAAVIGMIALALVTAPRPVPPVSSLGPPVSLGDVWTVISRRCTECHSSRPTSSIFTVAAGGVALDTAEQIEGRAADIYKRVVEQHTMPLANLTGMTQGEREIIARWHAGNVAPAGGDAAREGGVRGVADATAAALEARGLYALRCATCHGAEGRGNGISAVAFNPRPRDFGSRAWQESARDEVLARIIVGGGPAGGKSVQMPPNPDLADRPEIVAALIALIRSFRLE